MLVKANCLLGQKIVEKEKELSEPKEYEVQVQGKLCGICGSDTAVFYGKEQYLGDAMWGHEGLGIISKIGAKVTTVKVGDIVATFFHPSFWSYYNIPEDTVVKVPEISSKYIVQPISCPLNALYEVGLENLKNKKILVIGSGFMAYIFSKYLDIFGINNVDYYGHYNEDLFKNRITEPTQEYDYVIKVSITNDYDLILRALKVGGTLVNYATPRVDYSTNFFKWNWNSLKIIFPSPRGEHYKKAFQDCVQYADSLDFDKFSKEWSITEMEDAFVAENSKKGLVKNYIKF